MAKSLLHMVNIYSTVNSKVDNFLVFKAQVRESQEVLEVVNSYLSIPVTSFDVRKIEQVGVSNLLTDKIKTLNSNLLLQVTIGDETESPACQITCGLEIGTAGCFEPTVKTEKSEEAICISSSSEPDDLSDDGEVSLNLLLSPRWGGRDRQS